MSESKENALLKGTIYDDALWKYFINFGFFDDAIKTRAFALKVNPNKDKITIPLTPTNDPVLIQILIIEKGLAVKKLGFDVTFILRDNDHDAQNYCEPFIELLEKRFAQVDFNAPEIYRVSSFQEYYSDLVRKLRTKFEELCNYDSDESSQSEEIIEPPRIPVFQELVLDALTWLIATKALGSSFCYLGQVEAYPTENALGILQKLSKDAIPHILYFPELWFFAGTHIYLDNEREDIIRKLEDSRENRFRSVWEYVVHLKALAYLAGHDEGAFTDIFDQPFEEDYRTHINEELKKLATRIDDVLSIWRGLNTNV